MAVTQYCGLNWENKEHWVHLRTTNPIESTLATVRLRQRVTKGAGSGAAGIAMAFMLTESAQAQWRAVNAPHLVGLVRAGGFFHKGKLLERPIDITLAQPDESPETEVASHPPRRRKESARLVSASCLVGIREKH